VCLLYVSSICPFPSPLPKCASSFRNSFLHDVALFFFPDCRQDLEFAAGFFQHWTSFPLFYPYLRDGGLIYASPFSLRLSQLSGAFSEFPPMTSPLLRFFTHIMPPASMESFNLMIVADSMFHVPPSSFFFWYSPGGPSLLYSSFVRLIQVLSALLPPHLPLDILQIDLNMNVFRRLHRFFKLPRLISYSTRNKDRVPFLTTFIFCSHSSCESAPSS